MIGFLNFQSTAGLDKAAGQSKGAASDGANAGGFAAVLARVVAAEEMAEGTGPTGKLGQLATLLGKFRGEAQDALAEAFPDGMIVPGEALNDWARNMMAKLDGMLQQAGMTLADVSSVLGNLDLTALEGAGPMLSQAAQGLLTGVDGAGLSDGAATVMGTDLTEVEIPTLREALGMVAGEGPASDASAMIEGGEGALKSQIAAMLTDPSVSTELANLDPATPLPDAVKILLAQALAAPADRMLPPEVQAILSAPQPTAAPLIASVAETSAPPQQPPAPSNGLARNLAGQIRGVSFSEGTTRIELSPQGLGKIEVEIAADEAGKLRVVLRAENPAVLNAMRSDREMLAGLLRDGGSSVDESAMSFEEFGQQRQSFGQDNGAAGQVASRLTLDDAPQDDTEVTDQTQPAIDADGRLNVLT
ncbi:flagellar hook-length control protein FliK [Pseudooceanicola sp. MF1-13]|uniref:flagellar hook-length control protein FliK n=1 Tax=Pseudooceanicola sp. MF1-13 TaxID=3379095 RepID=UPI003892B9B1